MKLVWLTDLHFEFLTAQQARTFIGTVRVEDPDAVLVTGDISNARLIEFHLGLLAQLLPCQIYFLLGNHDLYLGGFAEVDALVRDLCARHPNLNELGHGEIIPLGQRTVLIGHRGWADGRAGVGSRSTIRLNDSECITDLRGLEPVDLFALLNRLGDESADYVRRLAPEALKKVDELIVATHVPPFVEAALYQGKPSEPNYAPHFVNVAMGRALQEVARQNAGKQIRVLCGHTHHEALFSPAPNLKVEVARADYRNPQVAGILTIE
jgi:Icc protein